MALTMRTRRTPARSVSGWTGVTGYGRSERVAGDIVRPSARSGPNAA